MHNVPLDPQRRPPAPPPRVIYRDLNLTRVCHSAGLPQLLPVANEKRGLHPAVRGANRTATLLYLFLSEMLFVNERDLTLCGLDATGCIYRNVSASR